VKERLILADRIAHFVGSGTFIAAQSIFLAAYIAYQTLNPVSFDPFPFILLNLLLSFQSAYTGPFVLWSQSRSAARDREVMEEIRTLVEQVKTLEERVLKKLEDNSRR
jgi:uncharacterized membrane protein